MSYAIPLFGVLIRKQSRPARTVCYRQTVEALHRLLDENQYAVSATNTITFVIILF